MVSSPVSYFGGKSWIASRLAASFPPHKHYVEVCGGSLAVLLSKKPSRMETVNDLDGHLMTFWRVLRDCPTDLERVCFLTPHSRAERELAHSFPEGLDELEIARRVFVALTQGRTGSITRTGWRHNSAPTSTPMPVVLQRHARRIALAARRIQNVSLECRPAVEMIRAYGGDRRNLLYVDPPYITDPGVRRGGEYRIDMRSVGAHRELLSACVEADAAVVISGYQSQVYSEMLDGWYRYEIPTSTQQGSGHGRRVEVIWSNRALVGLGKGSDDEPISCHDGGQRHETPARCPGCSAVVRQPQRGRRKVWCSDSCKSRGYRARRDVEGGGIGDQEDEAVG